MKFRALLLLGGIALLSLASTTSPGEAANLKAIEHVRPMKSIDQTIMVASATLSRNGAASTGAGPYTRGLRYLHSGRFAEATRAFHQAIAQHDHVADAYAGLGDVALSQRHYAPALREYKRAVSLSPSNSLYEYRASYAALYSNDYHASVRYASAYIQLRPRDPQGYHLRFLAYGGLLDRKHQVSDAVVVAKLEPHSASAQNDVGIALTNNQKYTEAMQAFSRAISLEPRSALYYKNRAIAENLNKQPQLALNDLRKARSLTKDPNLKKTLDVVIAALEKKLHH